MKRSMDKMDYRSHYNWNQREGQVGYQKQISRDRERAMANSNDKC